MSSADPFAGLPCNHFAAILADPPVSFETWSDQGKRLLRRTALQHDDMGRVEGARPRLARRAGLRAVSLDILAALIPLKSGGTFVHNCSASIIGGIQSTRLAELHGLTSDGLLQRFLPVLMRAPSLPTDIDCSKTNTDYESSYL